MNKLNSFLSDIDSNTVSLSSNPKKSKFGGAVKGIMMASAVLIANAPGISMASTGSDISEFRRLGGYIGSVSDEQDAFSNKTGVNYVQSDVEKISSGGKKAMSLYSDFQVTGKEVRGESKEFLVGDKQFIVKPHDDIAGGTCFISHKVGAEFKKMYSVEKGQYATFVAGSNGQVNEIQVSCTDKADKIGPSVVNYKESYQSVSQADYQADLQKRSYMALGLAAAAAATLALGAALMGKIKAKRDKDLSIGKKASM